MSFCASLSALLLTALLLCRIKELPAALAPFAAVSLCSLALSFCGMAGGYVVGVWAIYIAAAASLVLLILDKPAARRALLGRFLCPAVVFFALASAGFYIILSIKQPVFTLWDEFSFWGIAAKTVFLKKNLYTLVETSMLSISYAPVLPLFSGFMQFFGSEFCEWQVCAAYDVLMMSVLSMLLSRCEWRRPARWIILSAFSLFGLYMFFYCFDGGKLFADCLSDIPLGVVFASPMLAWFSGDEHPAARFCCAAAGLGMLPLMKDTGLALGLVAAVIVAWDLIISQISLPLRRRIFGAALLFAAVVLCYLAWNAHYSTAVGESRTDYTGGYEYSVFDMLRGEDSYFNAVLERMFGSELRTRQFVMFGPMLEMVVVFTALPLICALLCKTRRGAVRVGCAGLLLCAGYFVYYLFLAYAYTAIYKHGSTVELPSFERYISSFVIGWYLAVVSITLSDAARWRFTRAHDAGCAVASLFLAALFYFSPVHPDQYLLTSRKVSVVMSEERSEIHKVGQYLLSTLPDGARCYVVCQGSNGFEWFVLNYESQPLYIMRQLDGGNFAAVDDSANNATSALPEDLAQYLIQNGADYLIVLRSDEYFADTFGGMFDDSLAGIESGEGWRLYSVEGTSAESLRLCAVD